MQYTVYNKKNFTYILTLLLTIQYLHYLQYSIYYSANITIQLFHLVYMYLGH